MGEVYSPQEVSSRKGSLNYYEPASRLLCHQNDQSHKSTSVKPKVGNAIVTKSLSSSCSSDLCV